MRLIIRRVRPTPGSQLALFATYSYHAFITDRDGETLELEADHRRHAEIENTIRDLKYGVGLNHMPSGRFAANAAWLAIQVMTHNLARWTARIGLGERIVTTKTLRRRFFSLAASPCILPRVGHGRAMYAAPWHGCERFHSRPDDPSATDPPSPQTRATPVRECLLLRPRPFHLALRNVRRRSRGLPAVSVFSRRPIYPKSSPDHPPSPLIANSAAVTSSLRWIRA